VNPSDLAIIAVTELPLMAMGLGVIVSNHRLAAKVLEKMGDRVRVVNPPRAPAEPQAQAGTVESITAARRPA